MTKKCLARVNVFGYPMASCDGYSVSIGCHGLVTDQCASTEYFQRGCMHHEPEYEDFDDWAEYVRSKHERPLLPEV